MPVKCIASGRTLAAVTGFAQISHTKQPTLTQTPPARTFHAMFDLVSPYAPAGDQPQAIAKLIEGLSAGAKHQTLLGVTPAKPSPSRMSSGA
jgi:hypothetical protein